MSDARQGALFFGPGLCHPSFAGHALYGEVVQAFQPPFVGSIPRQVRDSSKRILGVITAFTRQWPHSIPFRPGGATCRSAGGDPARPAALDDYELVCTDHPRRQARGLGAGHHRRAVPGMSEALVDRPLHPLRHRGRRPAPGRSRQRQPAQRRPLPGPDVSGTTPHPRRGAGRRPLTELDQGQVREHSRFSWFADEGPRHPAEVVVTPDRSRPSPTAGPPRPVRTRQPGHAARSARRAPRRRRPARHRPRRGRCISAYLRQLVRWTEPARPRSS